jgi:hypothetical protein
MGIIKRKLDLTAIIITSNEEKNINKCIKSINRFVKDIFVLDSFSNDKTQQILKKLKIRFKCKNFISFPDQFNSAIKLSNAKTTWLMRIDADEIVEKKFFIKLKKFLKNAKPNTKGVIINRKYYFNEIEINHGGVFPHETLRIWRKGYGKCNSDLMDEKIVTKPTQEKINISIIDNNSNDFVRWKKKHKNYAYLEAKNFIKKSKNLKIKNSSDYKKFKIYYKFPIIIRPLLLFFYRFFFKLGFLDGLNGLKFCYWQTLWFRMLVDLNILKLKIK